MNIIDSVNKILHYIHFHKSNGDTLLIGDDISFFKSSVSYVNYVNL